MSAEAGEQPRRARPLTGGAVMGAASRVSVAATGALTTIFVARVLGADGAGAFAIALTIIYVLTVFSTLGLEHGIAYYVSSRRWAATAAFRTALLVALAAGVVVAALGVLARVLVPSAFGGLSLPLCAVAAAAMPFALRWFYGSFVALSDDRYEAFVLPPAIQSAAALVLVVGLGAPLGIGGAVVGLALSHVLAAAATVALARRAGLSRVGDGTPTRTHLRRSLSFGIKGYLTNALQVLNYRVDLFVLSTVVPAATLGHYSVAIAVTTVMWLLPQALSDVLFPRIAALSASAGADADAEAHRAFVEAKSLRHTAIIVALGTVVLALALLFLVVPVYGGAFREAIGLGLIRLPGVALIGIAGIMSATILGRGHPIYGLYTTLVVTPATMAMYVTLIPWLKGPGAALASTLSFTLSFLLTLIFYRRATGRSALPLLLPTRSELDDYRLLAPRILAWARGLRARRGGGTT